MPNCGARGVETLISGKSGTPIHSQFSPSAAAGSSVACRVLDFHAESIFRQDKKQTRTQHGTRRIAVWARMRPGLIWLPTRRPAISIATTEARYAQRRSHKLDVVALGLLALALFLAVSLLTYNPADPPSSLVYPPHSKIANACGRSGALAAQCLLQSSGWGPISSSFSLAVVDGLLLARRQVTEPLSAGGRLGNGDGRLATLLACVYSGATPGPVIGPGAIWERRARRCWKCTSPGGALISDNQLHAGGAIALDRLSPVQSRLSVAPGDAGRRAGRRLAGSRRRKPEAADRKQNQKTKPRRDDMDGPVDADAEEEEENATDGAGPAVRIRGKRVNEAADEAGEESKGEEEATKPQRTQRTQRKKKPTTQTEGSEEEAAEAGARASGMKARLASALRIRNMGKPDERPRAGDAKSSTPPAGRKSRCNTNCRRSTC